MTGISFLSLVICGFYLDRPLLTTLCGLVFLLPFLFVLADFWKTPDGKRLETAGNSFRSLGSGLPI